MTYYVVIDITGDDNSEGFDTEGFVIKGARSAEIAKGAARGRARRMFPFAQKFEVISCEVAK